MLFLQASGEVEEYTKKDQRRTLIDSDGILTRRVWIQHESADVFRNRQNDLQRGEAGLKEGLV